MLRIAQDGINMASMDKFTWKYAKVQQGLNLSEWEGFTTATEQQIQTDIMEYLRWKGWFVFKIHQQGKYCYKGISDLIAVKDGVTIYVEVKNATGKLRPEQMKFMEDIERHGARYIVARSLDDVKAMG
jgi:hypothetical protein